MISLAKKQNNSQILTLSGWGQKFDSLEEIFNDQFFDPFFISSLDYSKFNQISDFFSNVSTQKLNPDIVIGWSLGGQLAVRLIEKEIIKPRLLILIAPPFQMVKNSKIRSGMTKSTYDKFFEDFSNSPNKTLKRFSILTAMNDKNSANIIKGLDIKDENLDSLKFWLEELGRFSCFDIDFSNMPRTLFFQGKQDMIVHVDQSKYFADRIKDFHLEIFESSGHAPHLSDLEKLRNIIKEEIISYVDMI